MIPEAQTLRSNLHWVASSWTYPRTREELDRLSGPRIFKSHMPCSMAVGGDPAQAPCRYVYIARNPKDVAVSYFEFESGKSWAGGYRGPWEHWLEMFLSGRVQRGCWFDHVLEWWEQRGLENVLFLRYEQMQLDFDATLRKLAAFLGYELSAELAQTIREETGFERMRESTFSNLRDVKELGKPFFRKGHIGTWKERFTDAESERFDAVIAARLGGTGLSFQFE